MTSEIQKKETPTDLLTDLDRVFDDMRERFANAWDFRLFGHPFLALDVPEASYLRTARTDVTDTGKSYKVVAEIPGIPKDKLDIRVRGATVEIRGESSSDQEQNKASYVHRERTYAGYYRALELPEPVVATEAKAKVDNGLLELELPKQHPTPEDHEVKIAVQ